MPNPLAVNRPGLLLLLMLGVACHFTQAVSAATVSVDTSHITNPHAPLLLGQSFDARANFTSASVPIGYFDPVDASILPIGQYWLDHLLQYSMRYPLGPVNQWNWKETVGPLRPKQALLGNQAVVFGLDEFMAMALAQSVSPANVHFMVNIYIDKNNPDMPRAIQDAADLIEYLNMPANAGYPWADQRVANGHAQPYGVKLFNLGNEPWVETEYDALTSGDPDPAQDGAKRYAAAAALFITAMKQIDPTIQITLSAGSPRANPALEAKMQLWDQTLIDLLGDQIYAMVPNFYYDSQLPLSWGVSASAAHLDALAQMIETYNGTHSNSLRIIIGEHAHAIQIDYSTSPPTNINPDFAMQWQATVSTADFLMMASQNELLERAHFFIFGNTAAVWHPIRYDGLDGNGGQIYTVMPATGLYEKLGPLVLEQALLTSVTSPAASDGDTYSVRAGAFQSEDGTLLNAVVVNRDPALAQTVDLSGLDGYTLTRAQILSSTGPTSETIQVMDLASTAALRSFELPALSVLLLEFSRTSSMSMISLSTIDLSTLLLDSACIKLGANAKLVAPALQAQFSYKGKSGLLSLQQAAFLASLPAPCSDDLLLSLSKGQINQAIYTTSTLQVGSKYFAVTAYHDAITHPRSLNAGRYIFGSVYYAEAGTSLETWFSSLNDFAAASTESFPANTDLDYVLVLPESIDNKDIILLDNGLPYQRAASGGMVKINLSTLGVGEHSFTAKVLNAHFQQSQASASRVIVVEPALP